MDKYPKGKVWAARVMSGLVILFLVLDSVVKLIPIQAVTEGMPKLGYSADLARPLGVILLTCTLIYAIPRTAFLGAILLTAYLGGAVATHARIGDPLFSHTLFPTYVAILAWGGLYGRDKRVRSLVSGGDQNN
jgi:hypothetical protein